METVLEDVELTEFQSQLIIAEYNYIVATLMQSNEDRALTSQLFLSTFVVLSAALLSIQFGSLNIRNLNYAFAVAFAALVLWGAVTLYQLARLRLTWNESVCAMNHIKQRATQNSPDLLTYFRWTNDVAPSKFKLNSFSSSLAILVTIIVGLACGFGMAFFDFSLNPSLLLTSLSKYILAGGGVSLLFFICFYWLPLREV